MIRDRALTLLRTVSKYGEPLENHCSRLAELAIALGEIEQIPMDEDLIWGACFLHDIGLCVKDPSERNYLKRGFKLVQKESAAWNLNEDQRQAMKDALLYNHSMSTVPGIHPLAELIRKAVSVEHSFGRITHGLDKRTVSSVFSKYSRKGFNRVLLSFFRIAILEDGPTELFRIFFPSSKPAAQGA